MKIRCIEIVMPEKIHETVREKGNKGMKIMLIMDNVECQEKRDYRRNREGMCCNPRKGTG
jgi:hypothetical protein